MKVNCLENRDISFNGFYDSKILKKTLGFAEKNGALFAAATSLILSATVRPAAIFAAPKTDKENKKVACAKSIASTLLEFGITFAIALPITKSVGLINKHPEKYLKPETINSLKENADNLLDSKAYTLANQMFKLGVGILVAVPKAILNLLSMPYILQMFNPESNQNKDQNQVSFKGKYDNKLAEHIGKNIDKKFVQDLSKKYKNSNFPMHINVFKDLLATGTFVAGVSKSKKIGEDRKGPLIYNSLFSTILCVLAGYGIDALTDKPAKNFVDKFISANKNDPKLRHYLDGFKIAKPVMIMGIIYYALIPLISTFLAELADKKAPVIKGKI